MVFTPDFSPASRSAVAAVVPDDRLTFLRNRVSWGAILAGVAAAMVVQLLLNIQGIGIGASSLDAAQSSNGSALQAQVQRLANPTDAQSAQDSIMAYVRASVSGDQAAASAARDRAVDALAKTANISPDEARTRLQQAEQQARQTADQVKQKAQQAAEVTRKGVASAGIFGFIALVLGAVAAWSGGGAGAPRRETTVVGVSR